VPASPLEALIVSAWGEVLQLEPPSLGPDTNPFEHGAHSLHAVRVHALLLRRLGRELTMTDLFRHPTARALAAYLSGGPPSVTDGAVERARLRRERASRRPRTEEA
jgi:acyl carrier protein